MTESFGSKVSVNKALVLALVMAAGCREAPKRDTRGSPTPIPDQATARPAKESPDRPADPTSRSTLLQREELRDGPLRQLVDPPEPLSFDGIAERDGRDRARQLLGAREQLMLRIESEPDTAESQARSEFSRQLRAAVGHCISVHPELWARTHSRELEVELHGQGSRPTVKWIHRMERGIEVSQDPLVDCIADTLQPHVGNARAKLRYPMGHAP